MEAERLAEAERERAYVLEAARWDSFICRGLVETTLPELIAEVRRQRDALREYGGHRPGCNMVAGPWREGPCTCGWADWSRS